MRRRVGRICFDLNLQEDIIFCVRANKTSGWEVIKSGVRYWLFTLYLSTHEAGRKQEVWLIYTASTRTVPSDSFIPLRDQILKVLQPSGIAPSAGV